MTATGGGTRVLIVEDDHSLRSALTAFLERLGHRVFAADTAERALDLLAKERFSAMLCDIRMSGMSGLELLPKALAVHPDLAVIMLTGVDEPRAAISCLKLGAADYLIKPVDLEELQHALQSALYRRDLELERRGVEEWLAHEVAARTKELVAQSRQLSRLSISVLGALVDTLEGQDPVLRGHSQRVADLGGRIAARLGLSAEEVDAIRAAGRVHDVGKLALREPGLRLAVPASEEIAAPDDDPDLALRLLEPLAHLEGMAVAEIVRSQHERYDGKGVPEGRRGEEIPIGSRIVAAASVYDELSVTGGERRTLEPREAVANLRSLVGLMLDPKVFAALVLEVGGAA